MSVKIEGDVKALLTKLDGLSKINLSAVMKNISEGLRTSTTDRFRQEESPEGIKWEPSARAIAENGLTLTKDAILKNSIRSYYGNKGAAIGTNDIRAATHQFGEKERTIRAKKGKSLAFIFEGKKVFVKKVVIHIPARPFLGFSEDDILDVQDEIEAAVRRS